MATIIRRNETSRQVKNLGWLIRYAGKVRALRVQVCRTSANGDSWGGCHMRVLFSDGTVYKTDWASRNLCYQWLHDRRSLRGVLLQWGSSRATQIGKPRRETPDLPVFHC